MFRKLVCAMFVMTVAVGFVFADTFQATITKVEGNKVTYQKYKKGAKGQKGEKDGDPVTMEAKDAKVVKGMFNKDTKKVEDGDAIEGGLAHEMFKNATEEKGVQATITTSDDNKSISKIVVGGKGKKKGT